MVQSCHVRVHFLDKCIPKAFDQFKQLYIQFQHFQIGSTRVKLLLRLVRSICVGLIIGERGLKVALSFTLYSGFFSYARDILDIVFMVMFFDRSHRFAVFFQEFTPIFRAAPVLDLGVNYVRYFFRKLSPLILEKSAYLNLN